MARLQPELLLQAYAVGVFPMAEGRADRRLFFVDPDRRGIIPLHRFRLPRRLRRLVRKRPFAIHCNRDFAGVIRACAAPGPGRPDTWINPEIERLYLALHARGHCHSVECWQDGKLVGGLYGVVLGGAFFGESMFSRADNASKVALLHLVVRLIAGGFLLLDTQFITDHLRQFGAVEVPRQDYRDLLARAIAVPARFYGEADGWGEEGGWPLVEAWLQSSTQTS